MPQSYSPNELREYIRQAMPESYSPREFINKINEGNNGQVFDPYGTEALRARMRVKKLEAGDIFAQAELEQQRQQQLEQAKQAEMQKAREALEHFRGYLSQWLSDDSINQRLGELEIFYDEVSQSAVIARPDRQPFGLNLSELGLTGELPLPKQLQISSLDCFDNQLTTLPDLPDSLTKLDCRRNRLTTLPDLPDSLTELWCGGNQLTTLPDLPDSLTGLNCRYNQLTTLPDLPDSLTVLSCWDNQLTTLPDLPDSLTVLDCGGNRLTTLPDLPDSLKELDCRSNQLTPEARQAVREQQKRIGFNRF